MNDQFPAQVYECIRELTDNKETDRLELLQKLTPTYGELNHSECKKMWEALETRSASNYDTLWVRVFIGNIEDSVALPPYFYKNTKYRETLLEGVNKHTNALSKIIEKEKLEAHLFYSTSVTFGSGFYCYEDLSEHDQAFIDESKQVIISFSKLLEGIQHRITEEVTKAHDGTKASKNIRAVRFVRVLSEHMKRQFKTPLLAIISTAANTLYDTNYSESDISQLINYSGVGKVE